MSVDQVAAEVAREIAAAIDAARFAEPLAAVALIFWTDEAEVEVVCCTRACHDALVAELIGPGEVNSSARSTRTTWACPRRWSSSPRRATSTSIRRATTSALDGAVCFASRSGRDVQNNRLLRASITTEQLDDVDARGLLQLPDA